MLKKDSMSPRVMDDLELATFISVDIGKYYAEAKRLLQLGLPSPCLVAVRSVVNLVCKQLGVISNIDLLQESSLVERIELLRNSRLLNSEIFHKIQELRKSGNVGAHPEENACDKMKLDELALKSIKVCFDLLQDVNLQIPNQGNIKSKFIDVIISPEVELKNQLYDAVFDGNPERLFEMSLLLQNIYEKEKEFSSPLNVKNILNRSHGLLQMAAYGDHSESLFRIGMLKIDGRIWGQTKNIGMQDIYLSMGLGNINAKAQIGAWHMYGTDDVPKDEKEGMQLLQQALEYDHPLALTVLGSIEETKKNYEAAYNYYIKAADAGYSSAKILLSKMAIYTNWVVRFNKVESWLREAIEDYPDDARYYLSVAQLKLSDDSIDIEKAREYFHNIARSDTERLYEAAKYLSSPPLEKNSLPIAALKISEVYKRVDESSGFYNDVFKLCKKIHRKLIVRLRNCDKANTEEVGVLSLSISHFNEDGVPIDDALVQFEKMSGIARGKATERISEGDIQKWYLDIMKPTPIKVSKIGMNSKCGCGSGKKFKKCCRI